MTTTAHTQPTQAARILAHLQSGKTLTPREARRLFLCDRLGARIFELRRAGHEIRSRLIHLPGSGKHVSQYWLEKPTPAHGQP